MEGQVSLLPKMLMQAHYVAQSDTAYSSEISSPASPPSTLRKTSTGWIKPSPTVNVYTTCGRHTDQLLFGGPSLSELARSVLKKK